MFRRVLATGVAAERLRAHRVRLTIVSRSRKTHPRIGRFSGSTESRHSDDWPVPAGQQVIHFHPPGSGTAIAMPKGALSLRLHACLPGSFRCNTNGRYANLTLKTE